MAWTLVAEKREDVATVTAPTGEITMPAMQSTIPGAVLYFTFKGKNTGSVGQTMKLECFIYTPTGGLWVIIDKDQSLAPGAEFSLTTSAVMAFSGIWFSLARLYAWF